jgi:predicted TPR repeat methyltransferase
MTSSKSRLRGSSGKAPPVVDRLMAAIRLHQQGEIEPAMAIYEEILRRSPDHVDALHFSAVALHQKGDHHAALARLARVLKLVPDHFDAHNNRGNIFKKLGRLDDAEVDYRRALDIRPRDVDALNNLGTVLRERGQLKEAESKFREVIALAPKHAAAWQNLGNTLIFMDRIADAIEAHREAVRLAPMSPRAYHYLAAVLSANDLLDEAKEVCQKWIQLFPQDPRAAHMLAACTGERTPSRASDDYVRAEFAGFAASFDSSLAKLDYKAPTLLAGEVGRLLGEHHVRNMALDAGCGTGLCGAFLRARSKHLVGVDLSPEMVDLARKRECYDELVVDELTAYLRKHEARFDLIVSADTLVYFGDLGEVLPAAAGALVAGGILAFTVERAADEDAASGYRIRPSGRYVHSREYVESRLTAAGFVDLAFREVHLRKEAGSWVEGFLISAKLPAASLPTPATS